MTYFDVLLTNAADVLLTAMLATPGSSREARYVQAFRTFMARAEQIQGGAA